MIRTYNELIKMDSFEERFKYLYLGQQVGYETFGFDRVFNQMFYTSKEWRRVRNQVIIRDTVGEYTLDLGCGAPITGSIIVHHMNPIAIEDIRDATEFLLNPDFLICCSDSTHKAVHYGESNIILPQTFAERTMFDTCPWKKG